MLLFALCEPEGIQTLDLQNRNLTLYSAKLRVLHPLLVQLSGCKVRHFFWFPQVFCKIFFFDWRIICNFARQKETLQNAQCLISIGNETKKSVCADAGYWPLHRLF